MIKNIKRLLLNKSCFIKLVSIFTLQTITFAIFDVSNIAWAQPSPNKKGNYSDGVWDRWLVVDRNPNGLRCHSRPGSNYPVIKKFYNNNIIYVPTQGYDLIQQDRKGNVWLEIVPDGYQYSTPCFVRANSRFIQPIPQ